MCGDESFQEKVSVTGATFDNQYVLRRLVTADHLLQKQYKITN